MQAVLIVACVLAVGVADAGLLRVPRVYNALITTHEKLLPSRAYPVSAPVLQPLAFAPFLLGAPAPLIAAPAEERAASNDTTEAPASTTDKPEEAVGNATAPALPLHVPLPFTIFNSYSYYSSLLPYSYHTYHAAPLVFGSPFLHPLALHYPAVGAGKSEAAEARSLPSGAKDDPEKESVSVESN